MWITRRTDYATRAVLALALADDGRPRKIHDLAEATSTPVNVLEQVLPQLRSAGIVRSERGPIGRLPAQPPARGHHARQGRPPHPGAARADLVRDPPRARAVRDGVGCALRDDWAEVRDATIAILDATTFADLAARAAGPWKAVSLTQTAPANGLTSSEHCGWTRLGPASLRLPGPREREHPHSSSRAGSC